MTDYVTAILYLYPGASFSTAGDAYEGIVWRDASPKPTQSELDAAYPAALAAQQALKTNAQTIGQQLDLALTANQNAINTLNAWLTTGPGAGTANLTSAQLSQAMRQAAQNQVTTFRELDGLVRLLRNKLDSTAGT